MFTTSILNLSITNFKSLIEYKETPILSILFFFFNLVKVSMILLACLFFKSLISCKRIVFIFLTLSFFSDLFTSEKIYFSQFSSLILFVTDGILVVISYFFKFRFPNIFSASPYACAVSILFIPSSLAFLKICLMFFFFNF